MKCGPRINAVGKAGITLIETLMAIAITVLIAGIFLSVYQVVSAAVERHERWRNGWLPAAGAVDTLRRDLACSLAPAGLKEPALALYRQAAGRRPPASSILLFTAVKPAPGELALIGVERVSYKVVFPPEEANPLGTLVRESSRITGAESLRPPLVEPLVRNVSIFEVWVLDESQWTDQWLPKEGRPLPKAARIHLEVYDGARTNSLDEKTLMPAGGGLKPAERKRRERRAEATGSRRRGSGRQRVQTAVAGAA